ncbi:HAMP domain-containing histidine kinase [Streptomyces sp. ASQP_92]|uniref:sensor histidine kinase n=1 Tax=Streptomyces sp. ASQP_92 TaxID=2979116 RepID=UPI0021C2241D|nr:HAMP domain-containing sensor histidine kinase [Streptomyces sp. ASQP_92]MCT9088989.1 HAMP domain-containing histidine kinase [Streptomyces sp. ASQP_92]
MNRRLVPTTERARLTALYGGLLLLAGCVLVGVIYVFVQYGLDNRIGSAFTGAVPGGPASPRPVVSPPGPLVPSEQAGKYAETQVVQVVAATTLNRLLTVSGIALAAFAVLSLVLAWWMAGRVLRPVAVITATARKLSGENLHQRIGLAGPPGELKQLADTFDEMLGRIEQLVDAQRRFAANAAHELRTPLAVQRAAAEIGLVDPDPERIRWIRDELIQVADSSEHLIESLLLLAASDQGLEHREPVALDEPMAAVAEEHREAAREQGIAVTTALEPLTVEGDPVLLTHLIRNLIGNALRYNHRDGTLHLALVAADRTLGVTNTGPVVPPDAVADLFEPFRRLDERRHAPGEGAGLGLALVASIARAHGGRATAQANPGGGLTVSVRFP